jgi:hypothetical protein
MRGSNQREPLVRQPTERPVSVVGIWRRKMKMIARVQIWKTRYLDQGHQIAQDGMDCKTAMPIH